MFNFSWKGLLLLALLTGLFPGRPFCQERRPNVILIMADDLGYETLGCNGGTSYQTPHLDRLAREGVRFTNAFSTPLCTPSRLTIMTGKYNFRNYVEFGYMHPGVKTFGNYMKEAGYRTFIAGKWQLNGIETQRPGWDDLTRPTHFGFDDYVLWQVVTRQSRYKDPVIRTPEGLMKDTKGKYGPDIFCEQVISFMEKQSAGAEPFFVYYPMVLTHSPFEPVPGRKAFAQNGGKRVNDTAYFKNMVEYMDEIVGRIVQATERLGIAEETVIIFTGDNGTDRRVVSMMNGQSVKGGKGQTNTNGIHVPLIAYWKGHAPAGNVSDRLVDFTDVVPTLAELASFPLPANDVFDGISFYGCLTGGKCAERPYVYNYYTRNGIPSEAVRYALDKRWKVYDGGAVYQWAEDREERRPVDERRLKTKERKQIATLRRAITGMKAQEGEKPNILVILVDDMGYGDVNYLGKSGQVPTPNLDRLFASGRIFTDAHSGSALCTPTRYGLITGRYSWRSPMKKGVLRGSSPPLIESDRFTIADLLEGAGYQTAVIGKWHLGLSWTPLDSTREVADTNLDFTQRVQGGPDALGFGYSYILPASLDMPPYVYLENGWCTDTQIVTMPKANDDEGRFWRKGKASASFRIEETLDHLAGKAKAYIREATARNKPFFLYLPLTSPHTPLLPSQEFAGRSGAGPYGDFVMHTDAVVGDILGLLDSLSLDQNTMVVFTSDNGAIWLPEQQKAYPRHAANHIFRGGKSDVWEGGHRMPFVVSWPGKIMPGEESFTICLNDLMATFAEITNHKLPPDAGPDSFSFANLLLDGPQTGMERRKFTIHQGGDGTLSIRMGKWKYIDSDGSGGWSMRFEPPAETPGQLYNIAKDPREKQNVYDAHPRRVSLLKSILEQEKNNTEK